MTITLGPWLMPNANPFTIGLQFIAENIACFLNFFKKLNSSKSTYVFEFKVKVELMVVNKILSCTWLFAEDLYQKC